MTTTIATVPTGFSGRPPPGPAMPVTPVPARAGTQANAFGQRTRDRLADGA